MASLPPPPTGDTMNAASPSGLSAAGSGSPQPATSKLVRKGSMGAGYLPHRVADKQAQMAKVIAILREKGFIPQELVDNEAQWFFGNLGIDDVYFESQTVETVADHILALYGAKIFAFIKNERALDINLERETADGAVYVHTSQPGVSQMEGPQHERRMDEKYLDGSDQKTAWRLESYRSSGTISSSITSSLRCYFLSKCKFVKPNPTPAEMLDIEKVSDQAFLELATPNTKVLYSNVMREVLKRTGPVIEVFDVPSSREKRVVIGYKQKTTQGFFSSLSDLYHYYELFSSRKYVEQFSNGVTIICLYLNPLPTSNAPPIETSIFQVMKEASLIYCLPTSGFHDLFQMGKLSLQESVYAHVVWIFCQHFINRLGNDYVALASLLDQANPTHVEVLSNLKKRLRSETFTREYLQEIIKQFPDLVSILYVHFAMVHYIQPKETIIRPSLSFQRMQTYQPLTDEEILAKIKHTVQNTHERMVFEAILSFNQHVLKTNFYQPTKTCISFRLEGGFLPQTEYPAKPFGMFFVIGSEFRGFHVRFKDIARGGIRIIRSRNREAYSINLRNLFDENYGLASTQHRKNKDIPEGGSKGTILMDMHALDKPKVAFEKYVDGILDLLLKGETPGIKEEIVDLYGKEEILFFGPDEGTADFMDWAALFARSRNYRTWKAFTTGKSPAIGGIPHDTYGMTTRGVHQFVVGILRKLNIREEDIRKLQTGGPDGDLGSNEIKISKDKTVGIVDGSGVLFDPNGLNRAEIERLAEKRQMINHFDLSKLSPQGFRVLVDENNVQLPDGTVVDSGLKFRNEFHVNSIINAELFVPCGGRPESIDLSNWKQLLGKDGSPRFKYIVEGANLFITQEARLRLEKAGVILFKDASANKGGVTSSSLEVLAALAFSDEEFERDMMVKDGKLPEFYKKYVVEVQKIIENNADLEFECLWKEGIRTGKSRSVLSDELSYAIVRLNEELQTTSLWDNVELRRTVLSEAIPDLLIERLGLDTILQRVPGPYIQAIFGSYLASRFVYKYGAEPSQFAFFDYLSPYLAKVNHK